MSSDRVNATCSTIAQKKHCLLCFIRSWSCLHVEVYRQARRPYRAVHPFQIEPVGGVGRAIAGGHGGLAFSSAGNSVCDVRNSDIA